MPKSLGGFFMWTISTLIVVAVGVAILSRTPFWPMIKPGG